MKIGDFPDLEHAKNICQVGQGSNCCRYLTMALDGWSCEKHSSLKSYLDFRARTGMMHAIGDNCEGKDSREEEFDNVKK
jgi:hypothetical protein